MKFSETTKILLVFSICDIAVEVPLQPIANCCAEVFILVNYLYLVIVDDSIRLGWRVFPKISVVGSKMHKDKLEMRYFVWFYIGTRHTQMH